MKIIKQGKPLECFSCGCVMEYESKDIRYAKSKEDIGILIPRYKTVEYPYVECPCCNKRVYI